MVEFIKSITKRFNSNEEERHIELGDASEFKGYKSLANAMAELNGLIEIEKMRYEMEVRIGVTKSVDPKDEQEMLN
jgi:hypothetical protein